MSETTNPTFEIRATQLPSPPRTYQFSVWLDNVQVSEGYAFLWDFGDGGGSELPSPVHTYAGTGNYQVNVDVKKIKDKPDPPGESNETKKPPNQPPSVTISVSK